MNVNGLLGVLCFAYSALVVFIAVKQPPALWNMGKIKVFRKLFGEKGAVIFFYIFAALFVGLGIWLFVASPIA